MMHKERLEVGFIGGCEAPIIHRAPRSIRRRSPREKLVKEDQLCAFELLASVAGKLQEESEEGSATGNATESKFHLHEHNLLSNRVCDEKSSKDGIPSGGIGPLTVGEQLHIKAEYGSEVLSGSNKDDVTGSSSMSIANSLVNSVGSVDLPLYRKSLSCAALEVRDDVKKNFGCDEYSRRRPFKPEMRIGHRRMRKVMTSRYWRAGAATRLRDSELCTTSQGMNNAFCRCRKRIRVQQAPIKKRKLSDHTFAIAYDCDDTDRSISNVSGKVRVSIKSFKVPEMYLEVPESATVGSLKRSVMEALTAILGRGIHVGIILQGQKVRDDNKTLQQAGISHCCSSLDNLGFTLEPTHITSAKPKQEYPVSDLDMKSPATPLMGDPQIWKLNNIPESSAKGPDQENMALVPVPLNRKAKRSEVSQRRARRPFSVAEVEGLVEAVEKLGTGRWRDVKMRAFENADHRTYVDLKDKWKTLVHTASILPQQRRGEQVPHELLSRVLAAHSYWSQHQYKNGTGTGRLQPLLPPSVAAEAAVGA